jgi:Fe-S-cluster containining protein
MTAELSAELHALTRQRQRELDEAIAAWRQGDGANMRIWCGPGCGNCCSLTVNTTLPEALALAAVLNDRQRQPLSATVTRLTEHARQATDARTFLVGYRAAVGPCPFLDAGANCTVYSDRPLACRALLATRPPDWCGVNLGGLPEVERAAFLAGLDRTVVAWPTHYAAAPQELAAEFERGLIFTMIRVHGFGVTGNLPFLVDLAGRGGCGEALAGGPAAFRDFLATHHGDHPLLAQIHEP